MRLLLDTQIFLWVQLTPDRLGAHRETVEDHANEPLVSAASSWEIAIKYALGRLPLPERPESYVPSRIRDFVSSKIRNVRWIRSAAPSPAFERKKRARPS